jgi:hypothetical protein
VPGSVTRNKSRKALVLNWLWRRCWRGKVVGADFMVAAWPRQRLSAAHRNSLPAVRFALYTQHHQHGNDAAGYDDARGFNDRTDHGMMLPPEERGLSPSSARRVGPFFGEAELQSLAAEINKSKDAAVIFADGPDPVTRQKALDILAEAERRYCVTTNAVTAHDSRRHTSEISCKKGRSSRANSMRPSGIWLII